MARDVATAKPSRAGDPSAPRTQAFVASFVVLASAGTYFALTAAKVGLPVYLPIAHRWALGARPEALPMDWFARAFAALAAGALAVPIGRAIARRSAWSQRPAAARLLFGVGFGTMFWAALYVVFALVTTPRQRDRHAPNATVDLDHR